MPYAVNESVRIWYETFGDKNAGETILFLSGAGGDHTLWRSQIEGLQGQYRIISVDNRGSGKSDLPKGPYSADAMAEDVRSVVEQEDAENLNLVGFSLGGLIAQKFASRYTGMVSRLVLMNCSLGSGNQDTILPKKEVSNMFLFSAALSQEDCCKNCVDYFFGPNFEKENPLEYKAFFDYTMKNSLGLLSQIPIMVSEERFLVLSTARCIPMMVILSRDDPVTPPENGEAFKNHLPHAVIEYLDGHHASMLIHPDDTTGLLRRFLSTTRQES